MPENTELQEIARQLYRSMTKEQQIIAIRLLAQMQESEESESPCSASVEANC